MTSQTERALHTAHRIRNGSLRDCRFIYKFGFNGDIDTTEETVWDQGGLYSYIPTPSVLTFSSSSADDTAAGTGAQTIMADGLDENYDQALEEISLNGQTEVSSTTTFARIFRMYVLAAGSGETAAGDIYAGTGTVTAGVPANIYAKITQGENQTLMCTYTVPRNRIGLLWAANVRSGGSSTAIVTARTVFRPFGGVFRTGVRVLINNTGANEQTAYPLPIQAKTDYEIRAVSSSPNTDVSATFQMMVATG